MVSAQQPSNDDTAALLARARLGDKAALEAVLASVAPAIERFGRRMCKNVHDAEDVLQDTLLNVANHLSDFEGRSSLSSWVFSLTRSACARKRRGLKDRPPLGAEHLQDKPDPTPGPEARAADQELASALSVALDDLSDGDREVILLRDVEGLSAPEAAASLGVSVAALKSRLHRARAALRGVLRPLWEPSASPTPAGCPDVVRLWSLKLEGDLSQGDCSAMEGHILGCAACAGACDALKRALLACHRVQTEEVPSDVQARVKAAIRAFATASTT